MEKSAREEFDLILEEVLRELPAYVTDLLKETPVIVEDEPTEQLLEEMEEEIGESDLCGLHSGIPLTERTSLDAYPSPTVILLFRGPILRLAGKKRGELRREIRITLLHEIGHHFGFSEERLIAMGYG